MINRIMFGGILIAMLVTPALADPALTIRETVLRRTPDHQSAQVANLPAGTAVELLQRQGGWYQINHASRQTGWLPLLSVRKERATAQQKPGSTGLKSLLSSYQTGSSGVTVATGVRGLDAVDLKNSQPNMAELAKIDRYTCNADDAREYAARAGLFRRNISWLSPTEQER